MLACCFVGHRNIEETDLLASRIRATVVELLNRGVKIFYFGSRSKFNDLCYRTVSELKQEHSNIRRVYVRAEYQYANQSYIDYLLENFEETFFPFQVEGSGKVAYVKRNQLMIDASDYCVFYYNPNYVLPSRKSAFGLPSKTVQSGTKLAYDYAVAKNKSVLNMFEN